MKILMLNYEFPPIGGGGGQAHLALLHQYAQRPELQVDVLTCAPKLGFFIQRIGNNVTIFRMGVRKKNLHLWRRSEVVEWLVKAGSCYRGLVKNGDYDLVHAFFGFPTGWLPYRTARRVPYIVSLRGSDVPGDNARLKLDYKILGPLVFKPIWRRASALVACSEGLKERSLKFLPSAQIDVIPNGVDLDVFHPAHVGCAPHTDSPRSSDDDGMHSTPYDSGVLRLLTVGRLSATKRLPLLIDAVEHLHGAGCDARLTIVGGGAGERDLHRIVRDKRLEESVTITGRCEPEQMPDIYREHDILVSASAQEGMSNAMLEAMASGLPIVTTRCEGVDELIADNGIVVDDAKPDILAAAVRRLADDRRLLKTMSLAARKRAERFGWDAAAESYLRLYAKVK